MNQQRNHSKAKTVQAENPCRYHKRKSQNTNRLTHIVTRNQEGSDSRQRYDNNNGRRYDACLNSSLSDHKNTYDTDRLANLLGKADSRLANRFKSNFHHHDFHQCRKRNRFPCRRKRQNQTCGYHFRMKRVHSNKQGWQG
ncbi:hypothetical protein D3C85_1261270 [compost metagenome]